MDQIVVWITNTLQQMWLNLWTWQGLMIIIGLTGQGLFFSRFILQWWVTEKRGRVTFPRGFWYLSLGGTALVFVYATYRRDPVFILGFSLNMIIYLRNLYFIHRKQPPPSATGHGDDQPPSS